MHFNTYCHDWKDRVCHSKRPANIKYFNYANNLYNNFLNSISIKLTDQTGTTLNLNNQFFSITLQLDIIKFIE